MSATVQGTEHLRTPTTLRGVIDALAGALRAAYGGRHAAKRIAADADKSPRTAEGYLAARSTIHAAELMLLMAKNDELERQVWALVRDIRERALCPTNADSGSAPGAGSTSPATPSEPTMAG